MPEFWRIALSILLMLAFSGALAWYLVTRASWAFALRRRHRYALGSLFASGLVALTVSRSLGSEQEALGATLGAFGGAVTLGVVISSVLLMPIELARFVAAQLRKLRQQPEQPERRAFLAQAATGGALALGSGSALYGTLFGRRDYTIETVPLVLPRLPRTLDGFTIVQLSDLHVGTFIGERELAAALSLVRDAKPDLIVLTGDLLDHDAAYAPRLARFARSLGGLARYGVHAIPGNHDYYAGVDATLRALDEAGAEVLLNRHVKVGDAGGQFSLGGVDDVRAPLYGGAGPRPAQAFAGADPELARVLLSHNPADFEQSHTFADLVLSGHTHGGQITMFVNPARLVLTHGLVRGHYTKEGTQLYVNRGFGTAGPPARIGSPPEVTKLVLSSRA
ncbi:MAG: metallophosphoesterase [Polyangiales bacterium]